MSSRSSHVHGNGHRHCPSPTTREAFEGAGEGAAGFKVRGDHLLPCGARVSPNPHAPKAKRGSERTHLNTDFEPKRGVRAEDASINGTLEAFGRAIEDVGSKGDEGLAQIDENRENPSDEAILGLVKSMFSDGVSLHALANHLEVARKSVVASLSGKFDSSSPPPSNFTSSKHSGADLVENEHGNEVSNHGAIREEEIEPGEIVNQFRSRDDLHHGKGIWASLVKQAAGGMKLSYIEPSPSSGKTKIKPPSSVML